MIIKIITIAIMPITVIITTIIRTTIIAIIEQKKKIQLIILISIYVFTSFLVFILYKSIAVSSH